MSEPTHLDGNAVAGVLRDIFTVDITAAVGGCDGCGAVAVMAETLVYVDAPAPSCAARAATPC